MDLVRAVNDLTPDIAEKIEAMWQRKEIKEIFDRRAELKIQVPSGSP